MLTHIFELNKICFIKKIQNLLTFKYTERYPNNETSKQLLHPKLRFYFS